VNNIPHALKEKLKKDPFMRRCALEDENCKGRIEWHHVFIFAGKQIQESWAIAGACSEYHHRFADRTDIKKRFVHVCLSRASDSELAPYCKVIDYVKMKHELQ